MKEPVEEMREDLRRVMDAYGVLTAVEAVGVLELLKQEIFDQMRVMPDK
jgi:hypothetical protein